MKVYVNTDNKGTLNLRESPTMTSKILAQIPYGTELEVNTTITEWAAVTYKSHSGYVKSQFLSEYSDGKTVTLYEVYNSLKQTLAMIERAMK